MLELINNKLKFSFQSISDDAKMSIGFQRTLRIPDDEKNYSLPPGKGLFPIVKIDDIAKDLIPDQWKEHGGVMFPMYQSEAMWITFSSNYIYNRNQSYPFAVRIATGKVSAITGKNFSTKLSEGDYVVVPNQPWLDGFCIGNNIIRQFVASPLGSAVSVEQQITGEDKVGGLQIEVIPMKYDIFTKKFPEIETFFDTFCRLESCNTTKSSAPIRKSKSLFDSRSVPDMSLAAGGKMKQQIFKDPYGLDVWDTENTSRVFVHLTNSMVWRALTGKEPPTVPMTAAEYTRAGLPWFDYYVDAPSNQGSSDMQKIKSLQEMGGQLPENESVDESKQVKNISPNNPNQVREGKF